MTKSKSGFRKALCLLMSVSMILMCFAGMSISSSAEISGIISGPSTLMINDTGVYQLTFSGESQPQSVADYSWTVTVISGNNPVLYEPSYDPVLSIKANSVGRIKIELTFAADSNIVEATPIFVDVAAGETPTITGEGGETSWSEGFFTVSLEAPDICFGILYTTDGTDPTNSTTALSANGCMVSVILDQTTTIKAVAVYSEGYSSLASATFTKEIDFEAPVITGTDDATTFTDSIEVTITSPSGTDIIYTLDGSDPSDADNINVIFYDGSFTLTETTTVKASAWCNNGIDKSDVTAVTFTKEAKSDPIIPDPDTEDEPEPEPEYDPQPVYYTAPAGSSSPAAPAEPAEEVSGSSDADWHFSGEFTETNSSELSWDAVPGAQDQKLYVKINDKYTLLETLGDETSADVVVSASGKYYVSKGGDYTVYKYSEEKEAFEKVGTLEKDKIGNVVKKNNITEDFKLTFTENGNTREASASIKVYYKPAAKATVEDNKITLKWKKVEDAAKYRVMRKTANGYRLVTETEKTAVRINNAKSGDYTYIVQALVDGEWTKAYKSDRVNVTVE